jgi:hypothetical protein
MVRRALTLNSLQYSAIRFYTPVGNASDLPGFAAFREHLLGGALRITFFPDVFP